MIDEREIVRRAVEALDPPEPAFERLRHRRDRKRRNQRVAAGVVGLVVFVAAVWVVTTGLPFDQSQTEVVPGEDVTGPAETGPMETGPTETGPTSFGQPWPPSTERPPIGAPPNAWHVTPEDIAVGESFMDAWLAGDGEAAAAMFNPEGTFDGLQPGLLPALHDWFRAGGWTLQGSGCGFPEWLNGLGYVGCGFTYENDLTRALGTGPNEGQLFFVIDAGNIEAATTRVLEIYRHNDWALTVDVDNMFRSPNPARLDLFGPVWDMFIEWISSSHPEDFGRMYDPDRGYPILDAQSIELWERYTDEFVASPQLAESFAEWMANQSLDVQARRTCMIATDRFWGTVRADNLRQGDPAFFSTLAEVSEETLAELRAIPLETEADRDAMDIFVPGAERLIELDRQQAEAAAAGDHKRMNELEEERFHVMLGSVIGGWWDWCPVSGFGG